jgi:hypothetical protein
MTVIHRNNDHNMRQQISEALTALENGAYTYAIKTGAQTAIGASFADVTETGLSVAASTNYMFEFWIIADADATTTGIDVSCNGPAAPNALHYTVTYWTSATTQAVMNATAYDTSTASTGSNGTQQAIFKVEGILRNGTNAGTLIARIKREAVGSGPNVRRGSFGRMRRLS